MQSRTTGFDRGTWVHPQVAIHFAHWISSKFAVAVTEIVLRFSTGQLRTEESQETARQLGVKGAISKDAWEEHNWILMTYGKDRGVYAGSFDYGGKMKAGRVDKNLADRVKSHVKEYENFALFAFTPSTNPYASERAILEDPEIAQHQLEYDSQKEIFDMSLGALTKSSGQELPTTMLPWRKRLQGKLKRKQSSYNWNFKLNSFVLEIARVSHAHRFPRQQRTSHPVQGKYLMPTSLSCQMSKQVYF